MTGDGDFHHVSRGRHVDVSVKLVHIAEDVVHFLVAVLLLVVAVVVLWHSTRDVLDTHHEFAERVASTVNGALFVIIVLEILRTVAAHFDDADLQLKPFITIGIISAVRHILTLGAQASLGAEAASSHDTQIDLGVNAAVAVGLVIALAIVRRSDAADAIAEESG